MHGPPELLGCRKALQAFPWATASVQHGNGVVRAESHCWKMRYKGCLLHPNNLTDEIFEWHHQYWEQATSVSWRGHKNPTFPHKECLRKCCVSHMGVSICGHPHQELPSPDSVPPGDKDFLCVSPYLPSFSAGFGKWVPEGWAHPGPGWVVVGWRWHLDHRGVPLPELLSRCWSPIRGIPRIPGCFLSQCWFLTGPVAPLAAMGKVAEAI